MKHKHKLLSRLFFFFAFLVLCLTHPLAQARIEVTCGEEELLYVYERASGSFITVDDDILNLHADFYDLPSAIEAIADGEIFEDQVALCPGLYTGAEIEGLSLSLFGVGSDPSEVTVTAGPSGTALVIEDATIRLTNLTIRDGFHDTQSGGIHTIASNLYLVDLVIEDNSTNRYGGALYFKANGHVLEINNVTFAHNASHFYDADGYSSTSCGGAVFLDLPLAYPDDLDIYPDPFALDPNILRVSNSRFEGNHCLNHAAGALAIRGFPIYATIDHSDFWDNQAASAGALKISNSIYWPYYDVGPELSYIELVGSRFLRNEASASTGAAYLGGSAAVFESTFKANRGLTGSGSLFILSVDSEIHDCLFIDNEGHDRGGAITYGWNPFLPSEPDLHTVTQSRFVNNTSAGHNSAGAIATDPNQQRYIISDSVFFGNDGDEAGAIFGSYINSLHIDRSVFVRNESQNHGGAIFAYTGSEGFSVTQSSFVQNKATLNGGAIYSYDIYPSHDPFAVHNTTFSKNEADEGSAIYMQPTLTPSMADEPKVTLSHVTVFKNESRLASAALVLADNDVTLKNSVFDQNSAADFVYNDCLLESGGMIQSDGYNVTQTESCLLTEDSDEELASDILLGALQVDDFGIPFHEPEPGSILIDAIPDDDGSCPFEVDQRDLERPQGGGCDVGAVEVLF